MNEAHWIKINFSLENFSTYLEFGITLIKPLYPPLQDLNSSGLQGAGGTRRWRQRIYTAQAKAVKAQLVEALDDESPEEVRATEQLVEQFETEQPNVTVLLPDLGKQVVAHLTAICK